MRDPRERLRDILEAIEAIGKYLDRDKTAFEKDELLQSWFLRHLQIIGEAARGLPAEVRELAPDIPWPKIIGMRNVLVHGYFEIDTEIVWNAVNLELPTLRPAILQLLRRLEE